MANGVFKYPIDPNALIQEAVLDPRLQDSEAKELKEQFTAAGFKNRMIQSGLYKPPKSILINIPQRRKQNSRRIGNGPDVQVALGGPAATAAHLELQLLQISSQSPATTEKLLPGPISGSNFPVARTRMK